MTTATITTTPPIERFAQVFARYAALRGRGVEEAVAKKAKDIGVRLYQGFSERRWKGPRSGTSGVAWREMRARSKAGDGLTIRDNLTIAPGAPTEHLERRALRGANGTLRRLRVPVRTSAHQRRVFSELTLRQSGIGVLAASFLLFRKRSSQAQGTYLQQNKSGATLGKLELTGEDAIITGFTAGLDKVGARYGIVDTALLDAAADMLTYIAGKERAAFERAFTETAA